MQRAGPLSKLLTALSIGGVLASPSAAENGKTFEYQGNQVYYVEAGEGQPMIFLHNGGTSHRIWEDQIAYFSRRYHVYALDHLGFGRSDKPDIDYPLEVHVGQLEAFFARLADEPAILVGHCMGGAAALVFTARHPERVAKLILTNVYTEQTLLAGSLAEQYRRFSSDPAALDTAVERARSAPARNVHSDDPAAAVTLARVISRADSYGMADRLLLPASMPPIFMIWGQENPVLPLVAGRRLSRRLAPEKFVTLPGLHHMVMVEDPAGYTRVLESFLDDREEQSTSADPR